jgi:hypothetical protein
MQCAGLKMIVLCTIVMALLTCLQHLLLRLLLLILTNRHLKMTGKATALSPAWTNIEATNV